MILGGPCGGVEEGGGAWGSLLGPRAWLGGAPWGRGWPWWGLGPELGGPWDWPRGWKWGGPCCTCRSLR